MVNEIMLLEEEIVRWRKAIMQFLSPNLADELDQDIFSGLSRPFYYFKAYGLFMNPMEFGEHRRTLWRLRNGSDTTSIDYLE